MTVCPSGQCFDVTQVPVLHRIAERLRVLRESPGGRFEDFTVLVVTFPPPAGAIVCRDAEEQPLTVFHATSREGVTVQARSEGTREQAVCRNADAKIRHSHLSSDAPCRS